MARRTPCLYSYSVLDKAWLYLLERGDGVVKIGFTRNPKSRYLQHRSAAKRQAGLVRFHLFGAVERREVIAAEKLAIAALASVCAERVGVEEFRGITFPTAMSIVREASRPKPSEQQAA